MLLKIFDERLLFYDAHTFCPNLFSNIVNFSLLRKLDPLRIRFRVLFNNRSGEYTFSELASLPLDTINEIQVFATLLGGKGGFGSNLKKQGGKLSKRTKSNYDACRDLQGNRIQSLKDSQKLQEWTENQPARHAKRKSEIESKLQVVIDKQTSRRIVGDASFHVHGQLAVDTVSCALDAGIIPMHYI